MPSGQEMDQACSTAPWAISKTAKVVKQNVYDTHHGEGE